MNTNNAHGKQTEKKNTIPSAIWLRRRKPHISAVDATVWNENKFNANIEKSTMSFRVVCIAHTFHSNRARSLGDKFGERAEW